MGERKEKPELQDIWLLFQNGFLMAYKDIFNAIKEKLKNKKKVETWAKILRIKQVQLGTTVWLALCWSLYVNESKI